MRENREDHIPGMTRDGAICASSATAVAGGGAVVKLRGRVYCNYAECYGRKCMYASRFHFLVRPQGKHCHYTYF